MQHEWRVIGIDGQAHQTARLHPALGLDNRLATSAYDDSWFTVLTDSLGNRFYESKWSFPTILYTYEKSYINRLQNGSASGGNSGGFRNLLGGDSAGFRNLFGGNSGGFRNLLGGDSAEFRNLFGGNSGGFGGNSGGFGGDSGGFGGDSGGFGGDSGGFGGNSGGF